MSARAALKRATADSHERVDRLFSTLKLGESEDYRRFLLAQAAAQLPLEQALDEAGAARILADWPERRRGPLLRQDLAKMGESAPEPIAVPPFGSEAALLGAIYVLEGSRLGGAVLKRSLSEGAPRAFLASPGAPGAWRKLLAKLDESLYEPGRVEEASSTARLVFGCFEAAGHRFVEYQDCRAMLIRST